VNRTTLLEKLKRKRQLGSPLAALLGGPLPPRPAVPGLPLDQHQRPEDGQGAAVA
jgi:hypothetical protein